MNAIAGLRLLWDGQSYIEVELDPAWHNKTCGLCGNYSDTADANDVYDNDDLTNREPPDHTKVARTWARGQCSRKDRQTTKQVCEFYLYKVLLIFNHHTLYSVHKRLLLEKLLHVQFTSLDCLTF